MKPISLPISATLTKQRLCVPALPKGNLLTIIGLLACPDRHQAAPSLRQALYLPCLRPPTSNCRQSYRAHLPLGKLFHLVQSRRILHRSYLRQCLRLRSNSEDLVPQDPDSCLDNTVLLYVTSAFNVFKSISIISIPLPVLFATKHKRTEVMQLIFLVLLGLV
jgi:hypothetical protein